MAEGLLARIGEDLRASLSVGAERTPSLSASGDVWLARWALACALVGLTLYLFCGYHAGFLRINGLAAQVPHRLWEWLTLLGDERVAFALTLFFSRRYPRVFWALIVAAVIGVAFSQFLKPLFSAVRPPGVLEADVFNLIGPRHRKSSFPSGHSVTAGVFFGVWVYYLRSRWARALLILIAVIAGMSRVAVGVHWPVDVAAGLAGGVLAAWLGARIASHLPWGIDYPSVHVAFVGVAAMFAATLLYSDGGYAGSADIQWVLSVAALVYAAWSYLIAPRKRPA